MVTWRCLTSFDHHNCFLSFHTRKLLSFETMGHSLLRLCLFCRQMICHNSDDKSSMNNASTNNSHDRLNLDDKCWSTDIVKQVETWMKNQRFSEQYAPSTQRSQYTPPPVTSERSRKRRKKGHNFRETESSVNETTESINYNDSEIVSTADGKRSQKKLFEPRDQRNAWHNNLKQQTLPKVFNGHVNRDSYIKTFERPGKNTRFGSIHDEIEFRKRYKRVSDLKNHLQFVNESYLSGKNILSEGKRIGPVINSKRYKNLDPSDTFAISPLETQDFKKSKSRNRNLLEATPVFQKTPRNYLRKKNVWQKFQKLPNINQGDIKTHKKALSESNVQFDDEPERGETSRSEFISSTLLSHDDSKSERAKSVVTDSSYGTFQEMKVTIHIRYKKPRPTPEGRSGEESASDTGSEDSFDNGSANQFDGRLHSKADDKPSHVEPEQTTTINAPLRSTEHKFTGNSSLRITESKFAGTLPFRNIEHKFSGSPPLRSIEHRYVGSPPLRNLSRTSNISRKSKEQCAPFEGGTLSSLVISDPVSKTPKIITGKVHE